MTVDEIRWTTGVDLRGFDRDMVRLGGQLTAMFDRIQRDLSAIKLPSLPSVGPDLGSGTKGGGGKAATPDGGSAAELASSLAPLASLKIPALDAIAGQVSRLAPLFERMAGAIILQFRRADAAGKLPLTDRAIRASRNYIERQFDSLPPKAQTVANAIDMALGGLQWTRNLGAQIRGFIASITPLNAKLAREANAAVGPMQQFGQIGVTTTRAVEGGANRVAGAFKGVGVQLAAAVGLFGVAFKSVEFIKGSIKAASDFNETLNASKSILGENAAAAERVANSMSRAFGTSKRDVLDFENAIGGFLKGVGYGGKQLETMIEQITHRVSDLSSNQNKSFDEVGKAFLIQYSGEQSDFMKRLGVDTTETSLKQVGLAQGFAKAGKEMIKFQKVATANAIIMDKTSFAAGDLAATIDDPANAFRKFQGQVANFQAVLGTTFLPVAAKALGYLNELATAGAAVFDGQSPGMISFTAALNEAVDTAAIFLRSWEDVIEIIGIRFGVMVDNFVKRIQNPGIAIGDQIGQDNLSSIEEWFRKVLPGPLGRAMLSDPAQKEKNPVGPKLNLTDPEPLIAPIVQRMSDREYQRRGGSTPLKPTAPATKKQPGPPVDEAAVAKQLEAAEKMKQFVKSFTDKARTPFEEYKDIMAMAKKAFEAGDITKEQYGRADIYATKESGLGKIENPETRFAGAAQAGTQEFAQAVNRAVFGTATKQTEQKEMISLNKEQRDELKGIRSDLKEKTKVATNKVEPKGSEVGQSGPFKTVGGFKI